MTTRKKQKSGKAAHGSLIVQGMAASVAAFAGWLLFHGHVITASLVGCIALGMVQSTVIANDQKPVDSD